MDVVLVLVVDVVVILILVVDHIICSVYLRLPKGTIEFVLMGGWGEWCERQSHLYVKPKYS